MSSSHKRLTWSKKRVEKGEKGEKWAQNALFCLCPKTNQTAKPHAFRPCLGGCCCLQMLVGTQKVITVVGWQRNRPTLLGLLLTALAAIPLLVP